MDYQAALELLTPLGQGHLLQYWEDLSSEQQTHLLAQIERLDVSLLAKQQQLLLTLEHPPRVFEPFPNFDVSGNKQDIEKGKEMIAHGLVGCLIIAGGQASRLHLDGPKGVCPITAIRHKSLFQLFAEKIIAAGKQAKRHLPVAIMTSPLNHDATVAFFEKNHLFGLDPHQLSFFSQAVLPLLDERGNLFLQTTDTIAEGPDGNGGALHQFYKNKLWQSWHKQGVQYLNFVLIDNPLADPFDAGLIGYHQRAGGEIVVKVTTKETPEESVGILVKEKYHAAVVEYTELDDKARTATNAEGSLKYSLANISLFSFTMDFIKNSAVDTNHPLPLHKAHKAVKYLNAEGMTVQADKPMAWKFEKFIFDILPRAAKVSALVYPREQSFAPLKQFSGDDSFEMVTAAIEANDRRILESVTGTPCTVTPLEISQDFYYPTEELLTTWHGRTVTQSGYIEAALKAVAR
ncbi:MAG: UTP--glucose-1-phosphate uridylyltransferase [Parachlamydiaceae bacterium]